MELADAAGMDIPVMATILRNFFTDKFPHLENEISHYFSVGNIASPNVNLTFVELSSRLLSKTGLFEVLSKSNTII